jgi:hypothetical protein
MRTLLALTLFAAACSSDGGGGDDGTSYNCAAETRSEEYFAGISKVGANGVQFKILDALPAPPARGDNVWTLELTKAGAPINGAAMVVTPFMPDHQHGAATDVTIEPMPTAGQYKLTPVNMWMPGMWETTIQVEGQDADKAVFKFCIPS